MADSEAFPLASSPIVGTSRGAPDAFLVLAYIAAAPCQRKDIAAALGTHHVTLWHLLRQMAATGLVQPTGHGKHVWSATPKGIEELRKLYASIGLILRGYR